MLSGRLAKRRWKIKAKTTATLGRVNGFNPATEKKLLPASLYKREGIRGRGRGEWFKGGVNRGNAGMMGEGRLT